MDGDSERGDDSILASPGALMISHSRSGDTSTFSRTETVGIRSRPVPSFLIRTRAVFSLKDRGVRQSSGAGQI